MQNDYHELTIKAVLREWVPGDKYQRAVPFYDNGFGPLWIVRDSIGICGVTRAQSFTEAYETAEDEFFPRATEEEIANFPVDYGDNWIDSGEWNEAYGFSGNNGIYCKDINGDSCEILTQELSEDLSLSLVIEVWDSEE